MFGSQHGTPVPNAAYGASFGPQEQFLTRYLLTIGEFDSGHSTRTGVPLSASAAGVLLRAGKSNPAGHRAAPLTPLELKALRRGE